MTYPRKVCTFARVRVRLLLLICVCGVWLFVSEGGMRVGAFCAKTNNKTASHKSRMLSVLDVLFSEVQMATCCVYFTVWIMLMFCCSKSKAQELTKNRSISRSANTFTDLTPLKPKDFFLLASTHHDTDSDSITVIKCRNKFKQKQQRQT